MEHMSRNPETELDARVPRPDDEHVASPTPAAHSLPAGARLMSAAIWHGSPDLDQANEMSAGCAIGHLGIELTELGASHLVGRMPVDSRTRQPFGILHGGASVLLAETLVSCAATFVSAPGKACVGMEINANHLRPVTSGWVTGTARPISLGRRSQVWEVRIVDDNDKLVCISRCTMAVIEGP
jgi:1,4-dihydroxy-2-naphthoyl-CoA hydrolase